MDEQTPVPASPRAVLAVLHAWSDRVLVFALALAVLLFLSWALLVPRLTGVAVQGAILTAREAEQAVKDIGEEVARLENERRGFVLPTRDPLYLALREGGASVPTFDAVRAAVTDAAAATPEGSAITVVTLEYDAPNAVARVAGDVSGVGPRSMTVLAAFVDALGAQGLVAGVSPPAFTRIDDAKRGIVSPFDIVLDIRPSR